MHLPNSIKWPPRYVLGSMLCSFGGFLFGMDTGIIGSVTVMKSFVLEFGHQSATAHGLIVSAILIPAALSSFFAGRLADAIGRPKGIAIGALIFGLGSALEAGAVDIAMFVIGRIVEGVGEGLYLGTLVVYICEISPPSQRGPLASGPQLLTTLGLVVGYFTCYGSAKMSSSLAWRTPFIVLSALSMIFVVASSIWLIPSPRWLILQGHHSKVSAAWDILGVDPAARETEVELRSSPARSTDKKTENKLLGAFASDVRSRTGLAIFLLFMQQLSGIDGVLYYAPLLFKQAGLSSSESSFLASGVSAIVIFSVTIPALAFSDKWGRRQSTIYGGLGLAITMLTIGGLYAGRTVHSNSGAGRWFVIVSIYLYAAVYSISWAVGMRVYVAESQPQRTRASATNIAYGSNWVANFLVALTTPILLARTSYGAYFLFGGCALLTALVCFGFMPETKGRSLEAIEGPFRHKIVGGEKLLKAIRRVSGGHRVD